MTSIEELPILTPEEITTLTNELEIYAYITIPHRFDDILRSFENEFDGYHKELLFYIQFWGQLANHPNLIETNLHTYAMRKLINTQNALQNLLRFRLRKLLYPGY